MATKSKAKGGILELVKTIVYALLLAGVIRTLFFQPFWIPSGSMKPTLLIGDFLFVNKMAYGYSRHSCPFSLCPIPGRILAREPERGDVVVFKHPVNGTDYIKRLIGLPGDMVQMRDGILYINGEMVPQVPDGTFHEVNEPQGPMASMPRCANRPVAPAGLHRRAVDRGRCRTGGGTRSSTSRTGSATRRRSSPCRRAVLHGREQPRQPDGLEAGIGRRCRQAENLIGRADRVIFSSGGPSMLAFWTGGFDLLEGDRGSPAAAGRLHAPTSPGPNCCARAAHHPSTASRRTRAVLEDRVRRDIVIAEALLACRSCRANEVVIWRRV